MSGESRTHVHRTLTDAERQRAMSFVAAGSSSETDRFDDLLTADLTHGPAAGFVSISIEGDDGELVAYAQASAANDGFSIGCIAHPPTRAHVDELRVSALHLLLAELPATSAVTWWASDEDAAVASRVGLIPHRRLLDMRVALPIGATTDVPVRSYRVGADDDAWLAVNNAAFAWHGEQGGWTLATLQQRQLEPWFDADGFLVHERDGRMAGFCWTKLHRGSTLVGEIYVVAVHPDFHGLGLGRALTVAGLQHMHEADGAPAAKLFVDADNTAAVTLYDHLGFTVADARQAFWRPRSYRSRTNMTDALTESLPTWNVADVHESFEARSFLDAMERTDADMTRLEALFEEHDIRATTPRRPTADDGAAADAVIVALNAAREHATVTRGFIYATTSTDSFDEKAAGLYAEFQMVESRERPLVARFAEWLASLGVDALAEHSQQVAEHHGSLLKIAARAEHLMSEDEESLYGELSNSGSSAWNQVQGVVTSQLSTQVAMPDGSTPTLPMAAVRGLATHADPAVRQAAYDAEMAAWPTVAPVCAAAMNGVKGEANVVNRRRGWPSPLDASLFANSVSRPTFDAMQQAVVDALADFRRWYRTKARLHGHDGPLPWRDLFAPLPFAPASISWDGLAIVRNAFDSYGGGLAKLLDRALDEQWIDAGPRAGKRGGAFCMSMGGDRSLVFLNWSGSVDSAQTTAHELGHAYHNTQLAHRTPLQRSLPMALAETASIFCETLVVEEGLQRLQGRDRLALLDVDLQGSGQVVVDIHSRFLFETEVFTRRQRRTLGVSELNELMLQSQADAYGDGIDQSTAHPYMWALKPHYYSSHFYNWPYTYGLLFGLGLFAQYQQDPQRFSAHYDDALSRVGMNTAEELAAVFGFDVTDVGFWTASLDIIRQRIAAYETLAADE